MKLYLTFDIGGTDVKYGIIDNNFNFIFKDTFPSKGNVDGNLILDDIVNISNELRNIHKIEGISVSSAGVINSNTGEVLSATNSIRNYTGINVINYLEEKLNLPITILNDVNSMALCEATIGSGKSFRRISALTIGTGIGGSIVLDKEIYEGVSYSAGEFGLMIINGAPYEENASLSSLVKYAKLKVDPNIKNGIDVFNAYDKGYYQAKMIVNNFYDTLAVGIVNIIYVTNPDVVILGGGITNRIQFLEELMPYIQKYLRQWEMKNTLIKIAKFKNDAGMIGALIHHLNKFNI